MKKLMIGMFGALAMVAGAEVESGNIVGFEERGVTMDKKIITGANFVSVGSESLNLQSIKMDADVVDGGAAIWWWNTQTGKYDADAYWYRNLYDADGEMLAISGWGDGENWVAVDKTFMPGESFWLQAGVNATVTLAGEVKSVDASVQYCGIDLAMDQKIQITNPFPGELDIQSIKMNADVVDGGAAIWWWNTETGKYDTDAYWYRNLYDADGEMLDFSGWGDGENWVAVDKTFTSGSGFWIQAGVDATVQFPNPFYQSAK